MPLLQVRLRSLIALCLLLPMALPVNAATSDYRTGFARWRGATNGFAAWQRTGVAIASNGALLLDPATARSERDPYPAGGYNGRNYYNGGAFLLGEATSPTMATTFSWTEAIASWNAHTPAGTWIETQIRAQIGARWTKWYSLGVWASDYSTVQRHSVGGQGDSDGSVAVDTLRLSSKAPASAFQLKLRLFSALTGAAPSVRNASVSYSTTPPSNPQLVAGNPHLWNRVLAVPECSQMVYRDGGEVWCSPTSTSMALGYWGVAGPCEPRVRAAVAGVYDWIYNGHGNWPFNTAYAATYNLEGYVTRFTSLAQAEPWIAAGVPVIISYAWKKGQLTGAAISSSNGHLGVLVGFDANGNPVVNDPAASSDATVQRTYRRSELESLWLSASGGAVYLIYPPGKAVPATQ